MPRTHFSAPALPDPTDLVKHTHQLLPRLRETQPLVQCLTNPVTVNFVANGLLALGATPAMTDIPGEAGSFARAASAVLINLGTPHSEQREAMLEAAETAHDAGTPWVLDPVAVGALPVRTALAHRLLDLSPTVIRGNASEIRALAGEGTGGRGVDSSDTTEAARDSALQLARTTGAVVAVSGETDLITNGHSIVRIANGHPLLTRITGAGCLLGAVVAAFVATGSTARTISPDSAAETSTDPLATTVTACTIYAIAAELAAEQTHRPGSFIPAFLDELDALTPEDVTARARITVEPAAAATPALNSTTGRTA
ncbi:hydroxyethylthiazole kinase [Citricoccus sp. K5]|uniref:hydroxyethylthiazole kinase n=1 Tax=Citricoccus sp. K5 TaxID=2653135 RepID=UPI0012F1D2F3|nr:hydroxyethylthiazole kinase [Citricoccus sp. K5]VXC09975.1 Hydroxyethylthiazole kinase [Citricoccus sp. K5]